MHSVENLDSNRISVQISLNYNPYLSINNIDEPTEG